MEKASEKLAAVFEAMQQLEIMATRGNVNNLKMMLDTIEDVYAAVMRMEQDLEDDREGGGDLVSD